LLSKFLSLYRDASTIYRNYSFVKSEVGHPPLERARRPGGMGASLLARERSTGKYPTSSLGGARRGCSARAPDPNA
jgi:hypothetical protein